MKTFKIEARTIGALGVATLFVEIKATSHDEAVQQFNAEFGHSHEYGATTNLVWADLHPTDLICAYDYSPASQLGRCTYPANDGATHCQKHRNEELR